LSPFLRASARLVATGDIYATQQLLGHADVSTTANVYVQGSPADLEDKLGGSGADELRTTIPIDAVRPESFRSKKRPERRKVEAMGWKGAKIRATEPSATGHASHMRRLLLTRRGGGSFARVSRGSQRIHTSSCERAEKPLHYAVLGINP
jgi:hypothetical protein